MEKSSEAKEKQSGKKANKETSSDKDVALEISAEPTVEKRDDKDNGSSRIQAVQYGGAPSYEPWVDPDYEQERNMSFEEKLRAFKKQSEERLLHIKRSREAKIGKKKVR